MSTKKFNLVILLIAISFYSCGPKIPPQNAIPMGVIETEGVEITAEDGSFKLTSGEVWTPPYQNSTAGSNFNTDQISVIESYRWAHERGAKKVRVKTPYLDKELYGLLLLSKVFEGCSGPATRSYQISVPRSYVQDALGGRISAVYEYYGPCGPYAQLPAFEGKTWVLWLSDIPFNL